MNPIASRLFLQIDEWAWVFLCIFLLRMFLRARSGPGPQVHARFAARVWLAAFAVVLVVGAVMVYGIGYAMLWRLTGEKFPW